MGMHQFTDAQQACRTFRSVSGCLVDLARREHDVGVFPIHPLDDLFDLKMAYNVTGTHNHGLARHISSQPVNTAPSPLRGRH